MSVFRLEGEYWTVEYQGVVFRLRDGKGLHYLAYLLRHPGEVVGAAELIGRVSGVEDCASEPSEPGTQPRFDAQIERARSAVSKRIKSALLRIQDHHPELGLHLARCIKTGRMCGYLPDATGPITWSE